MLPSVGSRTFEAFRLWNTSYFNIDVTYYNARFVGFAFAAQY